MHQTAESFSLGGAPTWVVIAVFVTVLGSAGMIADVGAATGEEFGWRGFLVTELASC